MLNGSNDDFKYMYSIFLWKRLSSKISLIEKLPRGRSPSLRPQKVGNCDVVSIPLDCRLAQTIKFSTSVEPLVRFSGDPDKALRDMIVGVE